MKTKPCRKFTGTIIGLALSALVLTSCGSQGPSGLKEGPDLSEGERELGLEGQAAGIDPQWWNKVQEDIKQSEYEPSLQEKDAIGDEFDEPKWHFANRAKDLRAYFGRDGVRLSQRTAEGGWGWSYKLQAIGREKSLAPVEEADAEVNGGAIEYERSTLKEWYRNTEEGVEQGFEIMEGPSGSGRLVIEGVVETDLSVNTNSADKIVFSTTARDVLEYRDLIVSDNLGIELEGEIVWENSRIILMIDDSLAEYPIHVDPLLTTPSWTAESDQAGALFGSSVSTAGDVNGDGFSDVIVGAPNYDGGERDEGRVYVYLGSSAGLGSSHSWTAEGDQEEALFGQSVSTAGDVNGDGLSDVIVGAPLYDNGERAEGRVCVYRGSSSSITGINSDPSLIWTAEANLESAHFGLSVSTAGDVNGDGFSDVIVGAPDYGLLIGGGGRVFVYLGSSTGLAPLHSWFQQSDQIYASLGVSVSTAGDVNGDGFSDVIIGESQYSNGQRWEGRAYVYLGSGTTSTGFRDSLPWMAESNQAYAFFGVSVSTAGDVNGDGFSDVIVGAYGYDNGEVNEGRAYVYLGSGTGLAASPPWMAEGNREYTLFGSSVSTAGDVNGDGFSDVIIGAAGYDNGETEEGRAYVYYGSGGGLGASSSWAQEGGQASAYFGSSVSTAGDVNGDGFSDVIVGAPDYDNGEAGEGRAYVYLGSSGGLAASPSWAEGGSRGVDYFGFSVSTAGDVNGDGFGDVIVGMPDYSNGETVEGRAYLYLGSSGGLSSSHSWTAEGNQVGAHFGLFVSNAGDVNGDGFSDVIVGAPDYSNGERNEGRAYVYLGSSSSAGIDSSLPWTAEGNQAVARFGWSVSTAGDVNGDGYSDVIIGAPGYDNGETDEGRAYVYLGSSTGLGASLPWTAEGNQRGAAFGVSVSTAGDVNRDGFSDVIIGTPYYEHGEIYEGRAYVYYGSSGGLAGSPWTQEGNQEIAAFGRSVSTAGDVNGDGFSDVIVGAYRYDNPDAEEGRAYVYYGSSAGLVASPWIQEGNQTYAWFGNSVSTAGDVNGDGFSDVIVGANGYTNGESSEGRAYVYLGSSGGLAGSSPWTAESNQVNAHFGTAVSTAGDVNGDGFSDVIVGTPYYGPGDWDPGAAFVYYGNGGAGFPINPRQARADGSVLIQKGNKSDSPSSFRLRALGKIPLGRGRLKLQWEVKPLGADFTGTGLGETAYVDTGVVGASFDELVSGLASSLNYHWRVRFKHSPLYNMGGVYSRWIYWGSNGKLEADLKILGAGGGGGGSGLESDSADGTYTVAGVPVVLADVDGDGLIEQYSCNGGELTSIEPGETVRDCGLRIVNGTEGNDDHDFRWDDRGGSPVPTVFVGGPGDDYIAGSSGDDLLLGGPGDDNLDGRQGNDIMSCGSGDDDCDGEGGDDIIYCGDGNDRCVGKGGNDTIYGGPGNDLINGYEGDDILDGGPGDDFVYGGNDNDELYCGDGDDVCKGAEGDDAVNGGDGTDYCSGGGGNDTIDCGAGEDLVNARSGNDVINSCDGEADTINGEGGRDTCTVDCSIDTAASCNQRNCCP